MRRTVLKFLMRHWDTSIKFGPMYTPTQYSKTQFICSDPQVCISDKTIFGLDWRTFSNSVSKPGTLSKVIHLSRSPLHESQDKGGLVLKCCILPPGGKDIFTNSCSAYTNGIFHTVFNARLKLHFLRMLRMIHNGEPKTCFLSDHPAVEMASVADTV